jgi:O-antigen ligase
VISPQAPDQTAITGHERFRPMPVWGEGWLFGLCALVLVSSLLLGGGTSGGFLADAILQLMAIPLLVVTLYRVSDLTAARPARWVSVFCLALALLPLLQVVPLPPQIWTALPNRDLESAAFHLLQRDLPWMPLSVSPSATWLSALSLMPPIAIFLGTALLGAPERRTLTLVVIAVGLLSVFVGLSQVAQGPSSPLRFFEVTNATEAVGFFANRNHFAALLYALTLLAAAWAVEAASAPTLAPKPFDTRRIIALIASFTVLFVLVAAQAMARSRAGLALTIVALLGAMALALADRRTLSGVTPGRLLLAATALAIMFAVQFTLYRLLERFADDPLRDSRIVFSRVTLAAAKQYLPFGSGMGTFVPVYATFERAQDALLDTYVNRAHNDVLEVGLESGALGFVLMAAFLIWFVRRCLSVWRGRIANREIDVALARAATIVVGLLVAHSFVDYPLRTQAMMGIMALACGFLVNAPGEAGNRADAARRETLPDGRETDPLKPSADRAMDQASRNPATRWGSDIEWPEEWRRK